MKRILSFLLLALAVFTIRAETLNFRWDLFPDANYTGYVLDMTKVALSPGVTNRSQHTNWALSITIAGRTTTNTSVTIAPSALLGTNWFYLTATGPSTGTNVVAPTDMSLPVVFYKGSGKPGGFYMGSVEIQSTTNLTASIQWKTEQILPVEYDASATNKFYRALLAINQGIPIIPSANPPPSPGN